MRTQWIVATFFVLLLVVAVVVGSRCTRQHGDSAPPSASAGMAYANQRSPSSMTTPPAAMTTAPHMRRWR